MNLAEQLPACAHAPVQLFSARQKGQLDVYGLWGCLRGQLLTDDSFIFNRVLSRLKDSVSRLADATPDDDEALTRLKVGARPSLHQLLHVLDRVRGLCRLGLQCAGGVYKR